MKCLAPIRERSTFNESLIHIDYATSSDGFPDSPARGEPWLDRVLDSDALARADDRAASVLPEVTNGHAQPVVRAEGCKRQT